MALVFLCGNKACGKTFFLNKLIRIHHVNGYDSDSELLKTSSCKTVRELYNEIGESKFRETENKVFDELVNRCGASAVIALGGGALDLVEKSNKLGNTIYLYQKPEVLFKRMEKQGLPVFIHNRNDFDKLYQIRNEFYSRYCKCTIDLSKTEEDRVCRILLEMYLN